MENGGVFPSRVVSDPLHLIHAFPHSTPGTLTHTHMHAVHSHHPPHTIAFLLLTDM